MTATAPTTNPYLAGNYAPIRTETSADDLPVIGTLPPQIAGLFVRNGPNPQFSPLGTYHWFDGDGMLHGIRIRNGRASYRNRYVRTRGFQRERQAGEALWWGLLEPAEDNPDGTVKNTANTALVWHGGRLLALWEGGAPHAVRAPELETLGPFDFGGKLQSPVTAHPKVDPVTGEMPFYGYSLTQPPYLRYSLADASGELLWSEPIDLPVGVMMHDFAITEHYTLFMDLPLTYRSERAERGESPLAFEPDRPARFGILPRHGDRHSIRWFEAPSCFVFHTLNAYEEGDEVVLVACRMRSTQVLELSDASADPEADAPRLHRWRFNLSTGAVREERLAQALSEFPALNDRWLGRPTRYGYTARMVSGTRTPLFDGLLKHDLAGGGTQVHAFGEGRYGGDPSFVPHPDETAEDAGWLLDLVHNTNTERSELIVVDAQAFEAEPVARVLLPQRVPYGFHSTWVTEAQLQAQAV